jgi:hypothetical protein
MDPAFAHAAFYVTLSHIRLLCDLMLFGIDEFPEHGAYFHHNRFIQEIEHAFEGRYEFGVTETVFYSMIAFLPATIGAKRQ